jgi:hypothetical protein
LEAFEAEFQAGAVRPPERKMMRSPGRYAIPLLLFFALAAQALGQEFKINWGGTIYTKWLWGNQRDAGSLYNFTTVPGEGYGDNGQGNEIEILISGKLSKKLEIRARVHSRFSQNFWTNFGGFGGRNPAGSGGDCIAGDCGEWDPRSNQYVKLRGATLVFTPGYSWLDSASLGANDFGQFDPFVIGRIRYIDRDNAAGILLQGSAAGRRFTWDAARISLPRLWAGPSFNTGAYTASDAAYGAQFKVAISPQFDFGGIGEYVNDIEVDSTDRNFDNGRRIRTRFRNTVVGAKTSIHVGTKVDVRGAFYYSTNDSASDLNAPASFGLNGYSPVIAGRHNDNSWKANVDFNDPFGVGLSFNVEGFFLGAEYTSMMAARRESDVLLTEGHDSAFAFPGPANAAYGIFGGNATRIGYGGWDGNAVQVATINVDNEFTDFDEPMAETAIGWKGVTFVPVFSKGAFDLSGEYTYLTYDTNWQAWGDPSRGIEDTDFPATENDTGVGHNFRTAYAPFQDKKTHIALVKGKYVIEVGKGIDLFGKAKYLKDTDKRMNDPGFLPYRAGDCPGGGAACAGNRNFYSPGHSTADIYGNPSVITVNGVTGYQWKPFDSLSDDDRDLKYWMFNLGAGYQLTEDLYGSLTYQHFNADLVDGNTAMQGYRLQEMAAGKHRKNQVIARFRYTLAGLSECGLEYQYNFGTYEPDFGGGFVTQFATDEISRNVHVPVGSPGFAGRFGGWNSLLTREFDQQRLKAYFKVQF